MQAGLLVQVRKVNNAHAVSQREDVTIVPLHPSWQTIKIISDLVRLLIRNFTLIDLTKIDCQMPTIREKKNNIVLEITKAPVRDQIAMNPKSYARLAMSWGSLEQGSG